MARIVATGIPHYVTQRGNRRQETFFSDDDCRAYLEVTAQFCSLCAVEVQACCPMANHVYLIVVPESKEAMTRAIGDTHPRYTRRLNFRQGWRGHLWQALFASFPLNERSLLAATRYIELNPLRVRLVNWPQDYQWSSAKAPIASGNDVLVKVAPLLNMVGDWGNSSQKSSADKSPTKNPNKD